MEEETVTLPKAPEGYTYKLVRVKHKVVHNISSNVENSKTLTAKQISSLKYRQDHREELRRQNRLYYEKNKEKIKEQKRLQYEEKKKKENQ